MTNHMQVIRAFHTLLCAGLVVLSMVHGWAALACAVTGLLPYPFRQKRTLLFVALPLTPLAVWMPKTALVVLAVLYLLFALLPKVPVPPTKGEMAELRRAAERTRQTQDLGNVRVTRSGTAYVVDKHGSWRRVKA